MRSTTPLLELRSISKSFGGVRALDDVSLSVVSGEVLALIGPNGSGKSTVFNVLSGVHRANAGAILWRGAPVRRPSAPHVCRLGIARTFQEASTFPDFSVARCLEVVRRAPASRVAAPIVNSKVTRELLDTTGLTTTMSQRAGELPYGTQRLLGIVLAVCTGPTLLLLDEPAAGLTGPDIGRLSHMLRTLRNAGLTLVVVDHNMAFVLALASRVVVLEAGRVIFEGSADAVVQDPLVREAYLGA